jgi:uncharacterized protein YlxW (UPF0749 family)
MHNEEIRKALFPHEVAAEESAKRTKLLEEKVQQYAKSAGRYEVLKGMGVVITVEGQGALYLQGEEMDEWFKNTVEKSRFGDAEVYAEGQAVNYKPTPRKKK